MTLHQFYADILHESHVPLPRQSLPGRAMRVREVSGTWGMSPYYGEKAEVVTSKQWFLARSD